LKRVTPTLNHFITSTPNWRAKGFVLFVSLFFLGSCLDDASLIGVKKEARFKVEYKEFDLSPTTVQVRPDSIRTQNQFVGLSKDVNRMLLGKSYDPNFGNAKATLFTKFVPAVGKISGKSNVVLEKLTLTLALDYYVHGDTNSFNTTYAVHEIVDPNFKRSPDYFATSSVSYDPEPLVTGSFYYNRDSILKSRKANTDGNTVNNRTDTLYFNLPIGSLGKLLLDTALLKGLYTTDSKGVSNYDSYKTDSVFKLTFKGLAVLPIESNKIIGISSYSPYSKLTLFYSYVENNVIIRSKYYYTFAPSYFNPPLAEPSFTKIDFDRMGSPLANLTTPHTEFNAADNYCYTQSGTGVFTKLDLTKVRAYFDTIPRLGINSAELVVTLDPIATKPHVNEPSSLFIRMLSLNNRYLRPTFSTTVAFQSNYYCSHSFVNNYDYYLDAVDDAQSVGMNYRTDANGRYYKGTLSDFMQRNLTLPKSVARINALGLVPGDAPLGKSLQGVSFKKDKVKLKIYYTRTL
jgi:hypothetical protein